jgi:hypothetical protein
MCFTRLTRKPEPNRALNIFINLAAVFGILVAAFLIVRYVCKKYGIKTPLYNCCDDNDDDYYDDDDICCDDENCEDACCCSTDTGESTDEDITGESDSEVKPD